MDYPVGSAIRLRETFTEDGVLTDPTTVTFHVLWPDGSEQTYTAPDVTNPSVGVYVLPLDPAFYVQLGTYIYWGVGVGALDATSEPRSFRIVGAIDDRQWGPCEPWVNADEVNEFCEASESSVDFEEATSVASDVLFQLVPRFSGTCGPTRVRPCGDPCGIPWWSPGGWSWGGEGWLRVDGEIPVSTTGCGCRALPVVKLSGRVREVHEVTIDGVVLAPSAYRVDDNMWLVRIDGDLWPSCQDDQAEYTDDGTFSVYYTFGVDPPSPAKLAAKELACAVYQTINGASLEDCPLPNNVTKVVRQGLTIDLKAFTGWGFDPEKKQWQTGLPLVDMFLNAYNPKGRRKRRSIVWSPDMEESARKLGP